MKKISIYLSLFCLFFGLLDMPVSARIKQVGATYQISIQTDKQKIRDNIEAIKGLPENANIAVGRTLDSASDLSSSISNDRNIKKITDSYKDKTARREALSQLTSEELDLIQNPSKYDIESQQYVADKFNKIYSSMRGLQPASSHFFDDEKLENEQGKNTKASETTAFYDPNSNDIYYEADKIQNDNNMAHALGHESKRQDLNQKNSQENNQTAIAFKAGKHTKQAFKKELKYKKVDNETNTKYVRSNADNEALAQGSKQASKVENVQPYMGIIANDIINNRYNMNVDDYSHELKQHTKEGLKEAGKAGKVVLIEMPFSPISPGDYMRIGLGKDPYTGKELSTEEYIESAVNLAYPIGLGKVLSGGAKMIKINNKITNKIKELPPLVDSVSDVKKGLDQTKDE